jgi:hypothetical protein
MFRKKVPVPCFRRRAENNEKSVPVGRWGDFAARVVAVPSILIEGEGPSR